MQKLKQEGFDIGINIKRLRLQKGYTQLQLIAKLELHGCPMSRYILSKIERGKYNIRIKELAIMQKYLECEYNAFFEGIKVEDIDTMETVEDNKG